MIFAFLAWKRDAFLKPFLFCGDKREMVSNFRREKRRWRLWPSPVVLLRFAFHDLGVSKIAWPGVLIPLALREYFCFVSVVCLPRCNSHPHKRKRSKNGEPCIYGMPTPRKADVGNTAGERESQHQRLSLYGSLKPFLSFRKRKERNGFEKASFCRRKREKAVSGSVLFAVARETTSKNEPPAGENLWIVSRETKRRAFSRVLFVTHHCKSYSPGKSRWGKLA